MNALIISCIIFYLLVMHMGRGKKSLWSAFSLVLLLGILINLQQTGILSNNTAKGIENVPINANLHSPILLIGNAQVDAFFASNGTAGNATDPYILENWQFSVAGFASAIDIRDSTRHIIIQNCTFTAAGTNNAASAISLYNSTYVTIRDNFITNIGIDGIFLFISKNNTIIGNTIMNSTRNGIYLYFNCSGNEITQNNVTFHGETGIHVREFCENNRIWYNYIGNNSEYQARCVNSPDNEWSNGTHGNYWSDYPTRYPNATIITETARDEPYYRWSQPYLIAGTPAVSDPLPLVSPDQYFEPPIPPVIYVPPQKTPGQIIAEIAGIGIMIGIFLAVFWAKKRPLSESLDPQIAKSVLPPEVILLEEFRSVLKQQNPIKKKEMAEKLNIQLPELYELMTTWSATIPFKFKGENISTDDFMLFSDAINAYRQ
jgi:parallel beta-helix repeat protein